MSLTNEIENIINSFNFLEDEPRDLAEAITKHIVEILPKEKDVWLDKHTGEPFSKNGFNNNGRTFVKDEKTEYYNQCLQEIKERIGE